MSVSLISIYYVLNSVIPPHHLPLSQIYSYKWVQGSLPPNGTERQGFCVRSTVHISKALSPAFDLQEYTSKDYSTWTESRWKSIKGRIFLVASHDLQVNPFFTLKIKKGTRVDDLKSKYEPLTGLRLVQ